VLLPLGRSNSQGRSSELHSVTIPHSPNSFSFFPSSSSFPLVLRHFQLCPDPLPVGCSNSPRSYPYDDCPILVTPQPSAGRACDDRQVPRPQVARRARRAARPRRPSHTHQPLTAARGPPRLFTLGALSAPAYKWCTRSTRRGRREDDLVALYAVLRSCHGLLYPFPLLSASP